MNKVYLILQSKKTAPQAHESRSHFHLVWKHTTIDSFTSACREFAAVQREGQKVGEHQIPPIVHTISLWLAKCRNHVMLFENSKFIIDFKMWALCVSCPLQTDTAGQEKEQTSKIFWLHTTTFSFILSISERLEAQWVELRRCGTGACFDSWSKTIWR